MLKKVSTIVMILGLIALFCEPIIPDILAIIGACVFIVSLLILLDISNKEECARCNCCKPKIDTISAKNNLSNS